MIDEELEELEAATSEHDIIDALLDVIVLTENQSRLENSTINYTAPLLPASVLTKFPALSLNSAIHPYVFGMDNTFCFQELFDLSKSYICLYGYDLDKCMDEVIKEISSRRGAMNPSTGKWEKFTDPISKSEWYKADYTNCLL
jgi:hypothetical protein